MTLQFEKLDASALSANTIVNRAKIPGGWLLVSTSNAGGGVTFYPDPEHKWDGNSLSGNLEKPTLVAHKPR